MAISDYIIKRIHEKQEDYNKYHFSRIQSEALKTYFDLAQEFENLEDVYQISVAILKVFFDYEARLYVIDFNEERMVSAACTDDDLDDPDGSLPNYIRTAISPYCSEQSLILPIRGNKELIEQLPFTARDNIIGILEIYPFEQRDQQQELFFEKYANRIGFSIHMRFLLQKNVEHVKFIQSLVGDIEHNVIVPNMVYRLFLRRMGGKIAKNKEIEDAVRNYHRENPVDIRPEGEAMLDELHEVNIGLEEEFTNIEKHHRSTSLFLETLLRRSHFDEGRLTLVKKECNIRKAVIIPQLERFAAQFAEKGIEIEHECGDPGCEEEISLVDVGLMAQVYGNFFSNALKYTVAAATKEGPRKFVAYGRNRVKDYFGPGKNGIKYYVFSSGPHIPAEDHENIFIEGHRGQDSKNRPGTGHGLAFVKNAIELHGGVIGYEPVPYGNNFFFVLPE